MTIEDPSAVENLTWWRTTKAITLATLSACIRGSASPSLSFNVRHGLSRSGSGTEIITGGVTIGDTDTGTAITSFDDPTIPANSWLWATTSDKDGAVDELALSLDFNEDG